MKPSSLALAAACIAMLSETGHAAEDTASANYVMKGCRDIEKRVTSTQNIDLQGLCAGAISAIANSDDGRCMPQDVTIGQAVRVVVYIDSQPTRLHERFNRLALEAIQKAWPCKR
jgi:Rap1a immunity proteins